VLAHEADEQVRSLAVDDDLDELLVEAGAVMTGQRPRLEDVAEPPLLEDLDAFVVVDVAVGVEHRQEEVRTRDVQDDELIGLLLEVDHLGQLRVEQVQVDEELHVLAELLGDHDRARLIAGTSVSAEAHFGSYGSELPRYRRGYGVNKTNAILT